MVVGSPGFWEILLVKAPRTTTGLCQGGLEEACVEHIAGRRGGHVLGARNGEQDVEDALCSSGTAAVLGTVY